MLTDRELLEFTFSETAHRFNIDNSLTFKTCGRAYYDLIKNATKLYEQVIRPLRKMYPAHEFRINSGYRCEALNPLVSGAPNSRHTKALAADISCRTMLPVDIYSALLKLPHVELLRYESFIHVAL